MDWTHGAQHTWDNHKITVKEANEALGDSDAAMFDPDPKGMSGQSIRVIGYSPTAGRLLTVILVRDPDVTWLWGANGWPSNSTDRTIYRTESET